MPSAATSLYGMWNAGLWIALLGLPLFAGAADYLEPKLLTASIYDKAQDGRVLFKFRRTATQTGDVVRVLREFRDPNGSLAAVERVLYKQGRLMRFELDELQIGTRGSATVRNGAIDFEYTSDRSGKPKLKRNTEGIEEEPLTADSMGPFLAARWDELNRGGMVKFRYLVVPRLETIGFKLTRESTANLHGRKVVRIKMSPTSWVIAQAVDPLIFTVEVDPPHRVLQYWGRTTPKVRAGQSWSDLDALSVFDWP